MTNFEQKCTIENCERNMQRKSDIIYDSRGVTVSSTPNFSFLRLEAFKILESLHAELNFKFSIFFENLIKINLQ